MLTWIIAGLIAAAAFGFPLLPVLAIGAFAMSAAAYFMNNRNSREMHLLASYGMFWAIRLTSTLLPESENGSLNAVFTWIMSDTVAIVVSILVIMLGMVHGIFGPFGASAPTRNDKETTKG